MDKREMELITGIVTCTAHIGCRLLERSIQGVFEYLNHLYCNIFQTLPEEGIPMWEFFEAMRPQTVYGISDRFLLYHVAIMVPDQNVLLFLGPCLTETPDNHFISQVLKKNHLGLSAQESFRNFYKRWPVLDQAVMHTLGRVIGRFLYGENPLDHRYFHAWDYKLVQPCYVDDASRILEMKSLEQIYEKENALLEAVSRGQRQEAFKLLTDHSEKLQMRRYTSDSLRNAKDSCIAFHAKVQKAAEKGGVHPFHLENVGEEFCCQMEDASTIQEVRNISQNMLRRYIQLVRRMAVPQCSDIVRQAVKLVQLGLSAPLSVKYLAESLNVHPDYLSRVFKRDMGIALTAYINKERIIRAIHYLTETQLPVRDIALYVGFEDVNYFSRVFKRYVECSPSQYRHIAQGKQEKERREQKKEENRLMRRIPGGELNRQTG